MLKKVLGFYTRYFALWVVLFGVAAYIRVRLHNNGVNGGGGVAETPGRSGINSNY